MDSYRLAYAIEAFRGRMAALGIDVAAIELRDDASKRAVLATLHSACVTAEQTALGQGVIARICGIAIKVSA